MWKKQILAVLALLMVPWLGTLLWMQVTGETASGSKKAAGMEADALGQLELENLRAGQESYGAEQEAAAVGSETVETGRERRIVMERDGVQTYLDLEAYLPGVIVCQMPKEQDGEEYHAQVWECQAVIARTYICRLMEGRSEIHEEELDMDYLGETSSPWGNVDDVLVRRLEKAEQAVKETAGVVMKYEDRYILPLFHEMSAGRTRQGQAEFPYLEPADSSADAKRDEYLQVLEWPKAEFAAKISQIPDAVPVTADQLPKEIQAVEKDDAGYLLQMKIGARIYTGDEIRYALGLPSACFSLEGDENVIRARVRGRGHGYGLSQAGADSMAAEGWGFEEILQHYYKNISLISE